VRSRVLLAGCVLAIVAGACTGADPDPRRGDGASATAPRPLIYAAVGASETAGVGTADPIEDAWPRVLWRSLPAGSVLYDFGVGGSTTGQAVAEQLEAAVATEADVATVWLNVNDLLRGVPPGRYGRDLREIVRGLRNGGSTTVLVANTPMLDTLPVYLACRAPSGRVETALGDVVECPPDAALVTPPPAAVRAAVDTYNRLIGRIAREEGAVLVDLHALGDIPTEHPEWVSADGFHPSTEGAIVVAEAFERALQAAGP
jgi:acyl-CoA thioesterase I